MKTMKLKANEAYYMFFRSGCRDYTAIGRDLEAMYRKIVHMYNDNCRGETRKNVNTFKNVSEECGPVQVYVVNTDLVWFDDEYNTIERSHHGKYIGDYIEMRGETK